MSRPKQDVSEELKETMRRAMDSLPDWYATCRHCGVTLSGTLNDLRKHRCEHESG